MLKSQLQCYFWRKEFVVGNLGDALVPLLLAGLGYGLASPATGVELQGNSGRCLIMIGSLLEQGHISNIAVGQQLPSPVGAIDVWGCGWTGKPVPNELRPLLHIYAVRGPHTVTGLGLPANTPLGDPALLLPYMTSWPAGSHDRTVVVPHWHRRYLISATERCRMTGCNELVPTCVIQRHAILQHSSIRMWMGLAKQQWLLGIRPVSPLAAVRRIAGAAFVLTGSLHSAILAQAYGVPWAAYDDGFVDGPAKWLDWAAYLGVRLEFVHTLAEGRAWWQAEGRRGALRDLSLLIESFPYGLSAQVKSKFALEIRR